MTNASQATDSPPEVFQSEKTAGWSPELEDSESEVAVKATFKETSLSIRWFRTEAACLAAAPANGPVNSPD